MTLKVKRKEKVTFVSLCIDLSIFYYPYHNWCNNYFSYTKIFFFFYNKVRCLECCNVRLTRRKHFVEMVKTVVYLINVFFFSHPLLELEISIRLDNIEIVHCLVLLDRGRCCTRKTTYEAEVSLKQPSTVQGATLNK